jgi:protein arginine N-methyltransferase 1
LIPQRDVLMAAVVQADPLYDTLLRPWELDGFDQSAARDAQLNTVHKCLEALELLVEPARWTTIVYETPPLGFVAGRLDWSVRKAATAHGIAVWFDAELHSDVRFSNAPGTSLAYGRLFLPWPSPVELWVGDAIGVDLWLRPDSDDHVWGWNTRIARASGDLVAGFKQSTFLGWPVSGAEVARQGLSHRPALNATGRAIRDVLSWMDGQTPTDDLAAQLVSEHPSRFRGHDAALALVRRLLRQYAE